MAGFETTRWSLVLAARADGPDALEALCKAYRPAVLAYIRGWGYSRTDAEDVTQSFFARFLERRVHAAADPLRGRFRVFLRTALHNFVISTRASANAAHRKSSQPDSGIDPDQLASESDADLPDRAFERAWALLVVHRALRRLRAEARDAGKLELFERLQDFLLEPPDRDDYERVAQATATRPNAIAVATHRLRQRLRELVMHELADTVSDPACELQQPVGSTRASGAVVGTQATFGLPNITTPVNCSTGSGAISGRFNGPSRTTVEGSAEQRGAQWPPRPSGVAGFLAQAALASDCACGAELRIR